MVRRIPRALRRAPQAAHPITVHVHWLDGGERDLHGWTSQWTRTRVCVMRSLEPGRFQPFWVRAEDVRRR
jgi:hypothetical protein